jgi:hypothetical protein
MVSFLHWACSYIIVNLNFSVKFQPNEYLKKDLLGKKQLILIAIDALSLKDHLLSTFNNYLHLSKTMNSKNII